MYEWSGEHQAIAEAVRRFVDAEIRPNLDELERPGASPFPLLRR